jgi:hypothetical protein
MIRAALASILALPLVACTTAGGERHDSGECPAGEVCSPETQNGLLFVGTVVAGEPLSATFGPVATAIGGTQEIELRYDPGDGYVPLALPYDADDDGGLGVAIDQTDGAVVSVRGVGSRANYLRILDRSTGALFDRHELAGAAVTSVYLVGTEYERVPSVDTELVWATGDQEIGVALGGEVQENNAPVMERLADTSMQLSMPGGERTGWDTLRVADAAVGIRQLGVTAGDKPPTTLDVEFVAGATSIIVDEDPSPLAPGATGAVCFAAMNGDRYVYGLTWQFDVDGVASTKGKGDVTRNCVTVTADAHGSGAIQVTAAAGGQQASATITWGAATRTTRDAVHAPTGGSVGLHFDSPLGERALLGE